MRPQNHKMSNFENGAPTIWFKLVSPVISFQSYKTSILFLKNIYFTIQTHRNRFIPTFWHMRFFKKNFNQIFFLIMWIFTTITTTFTIIWIKQLSAVWFRVLIFLNLKINAWFLFEIHFQLYCLQNLINKYKSFLPVSVDVFHIPNFY